MEFLHREVRDYFGDKNGVITLDETGFLKSGEDSVGVQRQYTGTAGKVTNCQVGTFLGYVSQHGSTLLDRNLYLPRKWVKDLARRKKAHVPESITFQSKPQQGLEMIQSMVNQRFPFRWVCADSLYGRNRMFRQGLFQLGLEFVVVIPSDDEVWWTKLRWSRIKNAKQTDYYSEPTTQKVPVNQIIQSLGKKKWKRLSVAEGSKGLREYDWAVVWVKLPEEPHQKVRLLCRRAISDGKLAYYLCHSHKNTSLSELIEVAGSRWSIEQCFKETKRELGLDQYQVRTWEGWHRHTLLVMLAHVFLAQLRAELALKEKPSIAMIRRLLEFALPLPRLLDKEKWQWLLWIRQHNLKAKKSHYERRGFVYAI